jgi:hypothetical protein
MLGKGPYSPLQLALQDFAEYLHDFPNGLTSENISVGFVIDVLSQGEEGSVEAVDELNAVVSGWVAFVSSEHIEPTGSTKEASVEPVAVDMVLLLGHMPADGAR